MVPFWRGNFIVPHYHLSFNLLLFPSEFFQSSMPCGQRFRNANRSWLGKQIPYARLTGIYALRVNFKRGLAYFANEQALFLLTVLSAILFKSIGDSSTQVWEVFIEK